MSGRTGEASTSGRYEGLIYIPISAENSFQAQIPQEKVDLIYLCFPNNPTGAIMSEELMNAVIQIIKKQINGLNIMIVVKLLSKDIISYLRKIGMILKKQAIGSIIMMMV